MAAAALLVPGKILLTVRSITAPVLVGMVEQVTLL